MPLPQDALDATQLRPRNGRRLSRRVGQCFDDGARRVVQPPAPVTVAPNHENRCARSTQERDEPRRRGARGGDPE
jgi:hypothetical protein